MINCLIVEDEPLAADVLKDYVKQVPFLSLRAVCADALDAASVLKNEKVDLIFLDLHLPVLKGFDFIRTLRHPPQVIITTAYHEYALQGYEWNVVDYLLKPIEFKRFMEAVNKVRPAMTTPASSAPITIAVGKKTIIIPADEILFIESQKEYIRVQTATNEYKLKYAISRIEQEIDRKQFLRVHRSFIVNINKIRSYSQSEIDLPGHTIPVGGNYREEVAKRLSAVF